MALMEQAAMVQVMINLQVVELIRQYDVEQQRIQRDALLAQQDDEEEAEDQAPPPRRPRRRPPKRWIKCWATPVQRLRFGYYNNLMAKLRADDQEEFFRMMRMTPAVFDELVTRLTPRLLKQDTRMRKALEPGLKVAITIRHLASGNKYSSVAYAFRISKKSVTKVVPEVCRAIRAELVDEVMHLPQDPDAWRAIAQEYYRRWNVPNALGAIDGKHIKIRKPDNSGSLYHNYKGFFSVVLMAVVDADYKFMFTDVGGVGHQSDCQLFNASQFKDALESGDLNLPPAEPMPNDNVPMNYFFLGDDAFPLRETMMKPYSQRGLSHDNRIYNYRISRGRRVVENAFGILAQKWQIFLGCMAQSPEVVIDIVHAAVCLHNFLRMRMPPAFRNRELDHEDEDHRVIPGVWRDNADLVPMDARQQGRRDLEVAKVQRQTLVAYFNSPAGSVPWQEERINAP